MWPQGEVWNQDIHLYSYRGQHILVDVHSGAVHLLDDVAWEVLCGLQENAGDLAGTRQELGRRVGESTFSQVLQELEEKLAAGTFLPPGPAPALAMQVPRPGLKALCLHVAHDCNFRCTYCFAGKGSFGRSRQLMDAATGRVALDYLLRESGPQRHLEVDFFGGEPLLNFEVVQELVGYGKYRAAGLGKEISFTLTTNGLLLDRGVQDFLNREHIQVVLSLDGRPQVHDRMRPLAGGGGSYAAILPRMQELVDSRHGENYYVRGTYTAFNRDFSRDAASILQAGFRRFSLEPVVAPAEKPYALHEEDYPLLAAEYDNLVEIYLEYQAARDPFLFFHFQVDLAQGPCLPKRLAGCGAGYQYLAVSPAGELYPCHQLMEEPAWLLGDVWQGVRYPERQEAFQHVNVLSQETCRGCWARFYCGGGCRANAWHTHGRLDRPELLGCLLEKKRLECAIYLQVQEMLAGDKKPLGGPGSN